LMRGGKIAYGVHPSESPYMANPHQCEALYGLPAYGMLQRDVESQKLVIGSQEGLRLNFSLLWRVDSQLGQLSHDRSNGALFLKLLKARLPAQACQHVAELTELFEASARDADSIRRFFWQRLPEGLDDVHEVSDFIDSSDAIVFSIGTDSTLAYRLMGVGYDVYQSPWGWVIVVDSEEKRLKAKMTVHSAFVHDKLALGVLEELHRAGLDKPQEHPRIRRPRRRSRRQSGG